MRLISELLPYASTAKRASRRSKKHGCSVSQRSGSAKTTPRVRWPRSSKLRARLQEAGAKLPVASSSYKPGEEPATRKGGGKGGKGGKKGA